MDVCRFYFPFAHCYCTKAYLSGEGDMVINWRV